MDESLHSDIKPKFDYGFLRVLDLFLNESALFDYIREQKILCGKCHEFKSIHFNETELTIKCDCGVGVLYPKRQDRGNAYFYKFITKRLHYARKNNF